MRWPPVRHLLIVVLVIVAVDEDGAPGGDALFWLDKPEGDGDSGQGNHWALS
jgi:hypothetical protein